MLLNVPSSVSGVILFSFMSSKMIGKLNISAVFAAVISRLYYTD